MAISRRGFQAQLMGGAATLMALPLNSWAQAGKPLRILVGFPPGGGTDAIARLLAEKLKDELGVAVLVENKAGAGGQIAAQALKAAAPDGNTVFLSHDHSISILPLVTKTQAMSPRKTSSRWRALQRL